MERRLLFVRHGESVANRAGRLDGYPDAPLTALGRRQAAALAKTLAALDLSKARLVCSPLKRARATAQAIADAAGLPVAVDSRLLAGEGRESLELGPAGAEVAGAIEDGFASGADPLIAVSHRFPMWAYLATHFGEAAAKALMEPVGNGDMLELHLGPAGLPSLRYHPLAVE